MGWWEGLVIDVRRLWIEPLEASGVGFLFSRAYGTENILLRLIPALKCRAIFSCAYGAVLRGANLPSLRDS